MSFRYLTAGESHGKGLVGILEGVPAGLKITVEMIQEQMRRRKLGFGRGARQKIETDLIEIISGIRLGETLGSPICLWVLNKDWAVWQKIMQAEPQEGEVRRIVRVPRPGHADLMGGIKYGHFDLRNVLERSSARETAIRVGIGAIARVFLETLGARLGSRVVRIGSKVDRAEMRVHPSEMNGKTDSSPVRCLNEKISEEMVKEIEASKKAGDTLGGEFEIHVSGIPLGIGSYAQWDRRLEGDLAKGLMSLNAIKGVEVGLGFQAASLPGSKVHDQIFPGTQEGRLRYQTNFSGGIEGGMATGQTLVIRVAMKPLATLMAPLQSVNLDTGDAQPAHIERSDVCAVPAAAVIGEAIVALTLAKAILEKFGGDSMKELLPRVQIWNKAHRIESFL